MAEGSKRLENDSTVILLLYTLLYAIFLYQYDSNSVAIFPSKVSLKKRVHKDKCTHSNTCMSMFDFVD